MSKTKNIQENKNILKEENVIDESICEPNDESICEPNDESICEPNVETIKLDYVVYLLVNTSNNKTYVGSTNNTTRRIRQHNGELVGGAKYTKLNKDNGQWLFYGMIKNLHKRQALSLEKKIQIKSRKLSGKPIERRLKAFNSILNEYNELNGSNIIFVKI
jgi:putative endonuclease